MNRIAYKIAASALVLSLTMVACSSQSGAMRRPAAASAANRADRQAAQLHEQAARALQQGQLAQALAAMEQAVSLAPRDAGYRLLLADIYLKSGRFESARATYADVLELDPSHLRATLSFALMQVALGRPQAAVAQLDEIGARAAPADLGLAYALAGMPERAIEILEPAARGYDATPRLRQNLALSYALAGDWRRARAVAAQDVSPADLASRMEQWAAFARPDARSAQVASLLGISPVADPGQPVGLALAPPAPVPDVGPSEAYAAAGPAELPAASEPLPVFAEAAPPPAAPDAVSDWGLPPQAEAPPAPAAEAAADVPAESPTYYTPAPQAPVESSEAELSYAAAAQTLTQPEPAAVRTASLSLPPAPLFRRQAPRAAVRAGNSRFVVQLGAFSNEGNAERAWQQAARRFGLDAHQPLTTTFSHQGRTLHRVSIAGFAGPGDAARLCGSIRAQGGACFVRTNAGDASVRWAARYGPGRNRNA